MRILVRAALPLLMAVFLSPRAFGAGAFTYATYLGASQFDGASGMAVDHAGNTIVVGQTQSRDFPLRNAADGNYAGSSEAFVVKINPAGEVVFSTYFGGNGDDTPSGVAVDDAGNVYVSGDTTSTDFPIAGGVDATLDSFRDGYIFVLSPSGSLLHSTYLGGNGEELLRSIAVDKTGRVVVTGETQSTNFPTTTDGVDKTYGGRGDVFVTILNGSLSAIVYSTYFGGSDNDNAAGVTTTGVGNIAVTGLTSSGDFSTLNAFDTTLNGIQDAFVLVFNASGGLVFSTYLGGSSIDKGQGVSTDAAGAIYVTGRTDSNDFPTTSAAFNQAYGGSSDAFVTKIGPSGSLTYSTYLGGSSADYGHAISVNSTGSAFVTGMTAGFPLINPIDSTLGGNTDAFVAELAPDGQSLLFSTYVGGSSSDSGNCIVATDDRVHLAGTTLSPDFPVSRGTAQPALGGAPDAFVVRAITYDSADVSVTKMAPLTEDAGNRIEYTLMVTNNGPTAADNLVLTDTLPANTTFSLITISGAPLLTCTTPEGGGIGTVRCTASFYPSGSKAIIKLLAQTSPSARGIVITNTASVSSSTSDPNRINDTSTALTTLMSSADVSVTLEANPTTVTAGSSITYTMNVQNNGPSDAIAVAITNVLPAGTTFQSAAQTSGPAFTCTTPPSGGIGAVTCNIPTLGSRTSASLRSSLL